MTLMFVYKPEKALDEPVRITQPISSLDSNSSSATEMSIIRGSNIAFNDFGLSSSMYPIFLSFPIILTFMYVKGFSSTTRSWNHQEPMFRNSAACRKPFLKILSENIAHWLRYAKSSEKNCFNSSTWANTTALHYQNFTAKQFLTQLLSYFLRFKFLNTKICIILNCD